MRTIPNNFRRGSALLVVLGMLAFMIISAVAFSAWMRSSRLPNSFLRRASASRMLAKAALAAAIDEIDVAIGDNLHPGLGNRRYSFRTDGRIRGVDVNANRNLWMGRVYIGQKEGNTSDDPMNHLLKAEKTVSTLTLEGLAYIPPPFVTEARYYSRHSNAATWHDLAFDSGRYAFTAIDVSDAFDVNALAANVGRSTSPYGRISLAYLFENGTHNGSLNDKAKEWDDFMNNQKLRSKSLAEIEVDNGEASGRDLVESSKVPLTSVADLNLAMYAEGGSAGVGGLPCPFSKYVSDSASTFYGCMPSGDEGKRISGMNFVADGWFPRKTSYSTSAGGSSVPEIDLSDEMNQPFPAADLDADKTVMHIAEQCNSTCAIRLRDRISRIGLALLYDYLDEDCTPISLALPSVERIPMVAAISHNFDASAIKINMTQLPQTPETDDAYDGNYIVSPPATSGNTQTRRIKKVCTYRFDPGKFVQGLEGGFKATVVYPFRHGKDVATPGRFSIDAHVDVFLSSEDLYQRTGNRTDVFHDGDRGTEAGFTQESLLSGVIRMPFPEQDIQFDNVQDEASAVKTVAFAGMRAAQLVPLLNSDDGRLFEVTWEVTQKRTKGAEDTAFTGNWTNDGNWERTDAICGFTPINKSGSADQAFATRQAVLAYLNGEHGKKARIRAAITVRIKDKNTGKTVDIVPGGLLDDKNFNNINNIGAMEEMGNVICGKPGPMMLFTGANEIILGDTENDNANEVAFDLAPKGVMCPDPRWNWAPEHWYVKEVDANGWLSEVQSLLGQNGRDRDIFMMTSDSRYMQSVYELACLPRLTTLENYGNDQLRGNMDQLGGIDRTEFYAGFDDLQNKHLMWKTYNPYYRKGVDGFDVHPDYGDCKRDPFNDLNIVNRGGFRINPFSDSTNTVLAAFANTPTDWWASGMDPDGQAGVTDSDRKSARNFNQKYAFNEYNTKAKFAWRDIERIAGNFISVMHDPDLWNESLNDGLEPIWQDAFDEGLNWSGDVGPNQGDWHNLFGTNVREVSSGNSDLDAITDELYDVDRKFLYGYWRECFAARQQLFLIFVRAEPMMMGGGAVGAVPPQLGARAVALVWRDPEPTPGHENDVKYPHKTRVLFYRQLD